MYVLQEDLDERGIGKERCVSAALAIPRAEIVSLMEQHDQIWRW